MIYLREVPRVARPAKGLSLLEVVVVSAVGAVLFVFIIKWVVTLMSVSSATLDTSVATRNATYLDARLSADIAGATGCDSPTSPPINYMSPTELELYITAARPDGTTGVQLVTWKLEDHVITRSISAIDPATGCKPGGNSGQTTSSSRVITSGVLKNGSFFTAAIDGTDITPDQNGVICSLDIEKGPTQGDGCYANTIHAKNMLLPIILYKHQDGTINNDPKNKNGVIDSVVNDEFAPLPFDRTYKLVGVK